MSPVFIALSETRLITETEDNEGNVSYSIIRCDTKNRNMGDVLFIRDDIKYETVLTKLESNLVYCDKGQKKIL